MAYAQAFVLRGLKIISEVSNDDHTFVSFQRVDSDDRTFAISMPKGSEPAKAIDLALIAEDFSRTKLVAPRE